MGGSNKYNVQDSVIKKRIFKDDIEKELLCYTPMRGPLYSIIEFLQGGGIQEVVSDTKYSQKYTYKFLGNLQNKESRRGVEDRPFFVYLIFGCEVAQGLEQRL